MVLTMRLEADVAQHDDLVVAVDLLERALEEGLGVLSVAAEPFLISAGDPRWRGGEALAIRVVAGPTDQCAHGGLGLRARRTGGVRAGT
jgi:hypothetical protein